MTRLKYFALTAIAAFCLTMTAPAMQAQVTINIGPEPVCPYGYFDYPPYPCAPYGYYGPEWFSGGVFIGVGPWFHGPKDFHGHVDNHYDPHHGYKGPMPKRGERAEANKRPEKMAHFKGNEERDGRGHVGNEKR